MQVSLQERQMSKQSVQTAEQLKQEGNQAFKGAHCATVPPPPPDGRHVGPRSTTAARAAAPQTSTMHTHSCCTAKRLRWTRAMRCCTATARSLPSGWRCGAVERRVLPRLCCLPLHRCTWHVP